MTIHGHDVDLARRGLPEAILFTLTAIGVGLIWVAPRLTPKN